MIECETCAYYFNHKCMCDGCKHTEKTEDDMMAYLNYIHASKEITALLERNSVRAKVLLSALKELISNG